MNTLVPLLVAASAAIIVLLGCAHLLFTFHGPKLLPRDQELIARMKEAKLVLTDETSIWKAWIGFNASHSSGAILFGVVYGYLSLVHSAFLFQSTFLLVVGLLWLGGYIFLAKRYWFSAPFRGILLAAAFYVIALVISRVWLNPDIS